MKIAIVGTGISAMTAAYLLHRDHDITVYEKADYVGGHTNTLDVHLAGKTYAVDTGFIVFNDWTYPNFCRLIDRLGVPWRSSTMSFSVCCERTGLAYNGGSIAGLFAQKRNALSPAFLGMLRDILRFNRLAKRFADEGDPSITMRAFLDRHRLGKRFEQQYLIPITAAIWSADPATLSTFPMRFLAEFLRNHGMLNCWNRPTWRTITDGSRNYMTQLTAPFADRIRLREPVLAVRRIDGGVAVDSASAIDQRYDHVVLGCHSDQALAILGGDATEDERAALSAIPYQPNEAILHTDRSVLPQRRSCWAAWNYRIPREHGRPVALTYNMNILQGLETPEPVCVTLNERERIAPDKVLRVIRYEHPMFGPRRADAHRLFDTINHVKGVSFCGAYWGYGFHEDGVVSALRAVAPLGVSL
ncbi:MAG: NAD(P)/FAD-dependent oxidoreductase [Phycisphaerales bacterium JB063]